MNRAPKARLWMLLCGIVVAGGAVGAVQLARSPENGDNRIMNQQSIGMATMDENRTIALRLRAETEDGAEGEGYFTYAPTDEGYESVLRHIGGLEPGESKPVPPWPD